MEETATSGQKNFAITDLGDVVYVTPYSVVKSVFLRHVWIKYQYLAVVLATPEFVVDWTQRVAFVDQR